MALPKKHAIRRLRAALATARSLAGTAKSAQSPSFTEWRRDTEVAIGYAFGTHSPHVAEFRAISFTPHAFSRDASTQEMRRVLMLMSGIDNACAILQSMITEIEEYWPEEGRGEGPSAEMTPEGKSGTDVFLVHGHDDGLRGSVARCISKLGLNPIILHEQASKGRTIIGKLEEESSPVGFAIILLTPDDIGSPKAAPDDAKPRARQNVIFEMGYFMGKLGVSRVCAMYKEGVELPSDFHGIVYIEVEGDWMLKLARELKSAGFDVDLNRLTS